MNFDLKTAFKTTVERRKDLEKSESKSYGFFESFDEEDSTYQYANVAESDFIVL